MNAELKQIVFNDIDVDTFWPDNEDDFVLYIQTVIGPAGEEGGHIFSFQVCTPKWLSANYSEDEVVFLRNYILAFKYDLDKIRNRISDYCRTTSGDTWNDIAIKLSRVGHWEFENYKLDERNGKNLRTDF